MEIIAEFREYWGENQIMRGIGGCSCEVTGRGTVDRIEKAE